MMRRRRDRIQIMEDILRAADDPRGALKTHLVYGANLNFMRLEQYLGFLLENKLLENKMTEVERYYLTTKGREFLSQLNETRSYLVAMG